MRSVSHWIDHAPSPLSKSTFESLSPRDDSVYAVASRGTAQDVTDAVSHASEFAATFSRTSPTDRESWLLRAAELLRERADEFANVLVDEIGSPISKARMEINLSIKNLTATAGLARQVGGNVFPSDASNRWSIGVRKPIGVVAGITPFNVPLIKGIKHSSLPLAVGNPFVWLPSEHTPFLAGMVAELYRDAGLPAGCFQMVTGLGNEIGEALVSDPRVALVGFTGSQQIGRHIQALCGATGKRVTLELGGKNPLIVLADADLPAAVRAAVMGGYLYQGQICMASSRILVEEPIADAFTDAFCHAVSNLKAGDLRDPHTVIGPIISQRQRERIQDHLTDAISQGAELLCGGQWNQNTLEPAVLTGVTDGMRIFREETFGPVVHLERVESSSAALAAANQSDDGLVASVFTNNLSLALEFAQGLEYGMVHINEMTIQQEPQAPFGGCKSSGFGREGLPTAIDDMTEWKWVTLSPS